TLNVTGENTVQSVIANTCNVAAGKDVFETTQSAIDAGVSLSDIRACIDSTVAKSPPGLELSHLAKGHWSAVLSFAWDRNFETALQEESLGSPAREDVFTVNGLLSVIPPRVVPSFKLLGTAGTADYAIEKAA